MSAGYIFNFNTYLHEFLIKTMLASSYWIEWLKYTKLAVIMLVTGLFYSAGTENY